MTALAIARPETWERTAKAFWVVIVGLLVVRIWQISAGLEGDIFYFTEVAQKTDGVAGWSEPWAYPPLAGLALSPLKYLGLEGAGQYFIFILSGVSLAAVLVGLWLYRVPLPNLSAAYVILTATLLGVLFFYRFDNITMATTLLGLLALSKGRDFAASGWLALGGFIKSWPFVLAGALGTVMGRWRVLAGAVVTVVGVTVVGLLAGAYPWSWLTFASGREIQAESFAALPAVWGGYLGLPGHGVDMEWYGAYGFAPYLGWVLVGLVMAVGVSVLWLTWACRNVVFCPAPRDFWREERLAYLLLITMSLLVVSPVLSPQFLLWPCAVITAGLAFGWLGREAVLSLFVLALSAVLYPGLYSSFVDGTSLMSILVLSSRDVLMVLIALSAAWRVWKAHRLVHSTHVKDIEDGEVPSEER